MWRVSSRESPQPNFPVPVQTIQGGISHRPSMLALVNRQHAVIQLEDRQVAARGIHRPNRATVPISLGVLVGGEVLEERLAVLGPRQPFALARLGEQLGVAVLAEAINHLTVIVVSILGMPKLV